MKRESVVEILIFFSNKSEVASYYLLLKDTNKVNKGFKNEDDIFVSTVTQYFDQLK